MLCAAWIVKKGAKKLGLTPFKILGWGLRRIFRRGKKKGKNGKDKGRGGTVPEQPQSRTQKYAALAQEKLAAKMSGGAPPGGARGAPGGQKPDAKGLGKMATTYAAHALADRLARDPNSKSGRVAAAMTAALGPKPEHAGAPKA